ncbi:succinylglutamate desuccinylase/aspartoacylase domain-containing protein [Marinobacterium mangrovicola]|uniref:Succinylglutamate desuccinylase/aspartoacylase family protein n=1 Tax=Marinobacterium mangrovicola TaxID=1476959 RepID=A0A4R1GMZ5_9GAMM|nr:succinylglutamate desuccinylase/aspartoacylase family protein [Marinobacterium mangrovicola]TCK08185.1 succinylglutamate desuccinylase/aspartoacylase family protein [Marinobacterium mangrovicola]
MTNDPIRVLEASPRCNWGETSGDFLQRLGGTTLILIPGRDRSRCRAVATLLHGNEPSGTHALHRYLRTGQEPAVDLLCFVVSVETALHERLFLYRHLPGLRDMNRCFQPPFNDLPGQVAQRMMQLLDQYQPECVIDIHNTSGAGPAFGVVSHEDALHEALVCLFTHHLVVTDLRLGALMELSRPGRPVVTIECGGAGDARADRVAYEGLVRYAEKDRVLKLESGQRMELYHSPVRLELASGATLAFDTRPVAGMDLTVPPDLERFNFGTAPEGTFIGWVGPNSRQRFSARNGNGIDRFDEWFRVDDQRLLTAQPLRLFMVTHRQDIALSDCLFYAAPEAGHSRLDS